MIKTQQIKLTTQDPIDVPNFVSINVLKWNNSKWKNLCPYLLKTDGLEANVNSGGIIFENYWQGSKVFSKVYKNEVYPSKYQKGNPKYLWWKFDPVTPTGDVILTNGAIDYNLYYRWRNDLWACPNPIRYPNGINNRSDTQFALVIDKNNKEHRLDYLTARREIYFKEYIRLIRKTSEYKELLDMINNGQNLLICEVDVPTNGKKGEYGKDCDVNGNCDMSIAKLNKLMADPSEAFGHGLCLVYALLTDKNP